MGCGVRNGAYTPSSGQQAISRDNVDYVRFQAFNTHPNSLATSFLLQQKWRKSYLKILSQDIKQPGLLNHHMEDNGFEESLGLQGTLSE